MLLLSLVLILALFLVSACQKPVAKPLPITEDGSNQGEISAKAYILHCKCESVGACDWKRRCVTTKEETIGGAIDICNDVIDTCDDYGGTSTLTRW